MEATLVDVVNVASERRVSHAAADEVGGAEAAHPEVGDLGEVQDGAVDAAIFWKFLRTLLKRYEKLKFKTLFLSLTRWQHLLESLVSY